MFDLITAVLTAIGSLGVALLMFLENVFPPIPSEVIMPLAGYLAASGELMVLSVIIAGTVGSVAGACLWYWIGSRATETGLRRLVIRYGRWLTISENDLDRSLSWFRQHGYATVLLGRMVPGVRTLISIPAGLTKMPLKPFLIYTTIGSIFWTTALTVAGYVLEAQFSKVEAWANPATDGLLFLIAATYVWRLISSKV